MKRKVVVSATMAASFADIAPSERKRIRLALEALADDPFGSHDDVDIKRLANTDPIKHRLKVGAYRIVYRVDGQTIKVLDVFRRERGYRE